MSSDDIVHETQDWSSPTDHFKIRHKWLTLWFDHDFLVQDWAKTKTAWLKPWYVPQWSPFYFVMTWFSARNRNLFLLENHLTYRPFAGRKNEKLKY
jgi:hypothetical protein